MSSKDRVNAQESQERPSRTKRTVDLNAPKEELVILKPKEIQAIQYDNYRQIDESKVEEYFQSIREVGVKVAIVVRKSESGLSLIDGHHRVEAARRLMRDYPHISITIQAIVRTGVSEKDEVVQKVVSNFTRRESIVDRAAGYRLLADNGKNSKQIADTVGKDRTTIENHLHFYAMYLKHKDVIDQNLASLKESFLYKLAHKFNREPDLDIASLVEKELAPKERKAATRIDPEAILIDLGYTKTDSKKICTALRNAGIKL